MPILPRPAVASSDFRPYCSPSSLHVSVEPANPKASRPPYKPSIVEDHGKNVADCSATKPTRAGGSIKQMNFTTSKAY